LQSWSRQDSLGARPPRSSRAWPVSPGDAYTTCPC